MLASKSPQIAIVSVAFEIVSNLIQHRGRGFRKMFALSEVYSLQM